MMIRDKNNIFERVENFHADLAWNYPVVFCGFCNEGSPLANDHPEGQYDGIGDFSGWMKVAFFFCKISFSTHVHYLGPNSQPKKSGKADRKVGEYKN